MVVGTRGAGIARRLGLPLGRALGARPGPGPRAPAEEAARRPQAWGAAAGVGASTPVSRMAVPGVAGVSSLPGLAPDRVLALSDPIGSDKYVILSEREGGIGPERAIELFSSFIWSSDGRCSHLDVCTLPTTREGMDAL
ncbi:unnamed protein product [Prorocentrum cordatum]|uniref:Uncharacterized protein n=1 Tax=Prorocentrum cordatum TaxID=2364126 RepID=A0ABN9XVV3_9DINO|nr:unnamed protein product [Polarella glacialis]